jgi:hypothetical protein
MHAIGFCGGSHCGRDHEQALLAAGAQRICRDAVSLAAVIADMSESLR